MRERKEETRGKGGNWNCALGGGGGAVVGRCFYLCRCEAYWLCKALAGACEAEAQTKRVCGLCLYYHSLRVCVKV